MDKELQEILRKNKIRTAARRQAKIKKQKKAELKEGILLFIILTFIVFATATLLAGMNNKTVENCISAGYSRGYCENLIK